MPTDPRHLLLLLFLLLLRSAAAATSGDADALAALAKSLTNPPSTWSSTPDPCKWDGIKCSGSRITSIDLNRRSLSGTLPSSLSSLSSLTSLNLAYNRLSGPLPSLAGLSSLQSLNLAGNSFTSIPSDFFTGLTGLQSVSLDDNPTLSPWPLSLPDCAALQSLSASNASIFSFIPPSLFALPALTSLQLSYNNLTGTIPDSVAGSPLQALLLNNQLGPRLSGPITPIAALSQLRTLYLQSNGFTGPIPDLSNITALQTFNVRDNQLTGPVPASLASAPALGAAMLSNNMLQGPFPVFANSSAVLDVDDGNNFCLKNPGPCDDRVTLLIAVAGGFNYPSDLASSWTGNDPCKGSWIGVTCGPNGKDVIVLNFANKQYVGTISPAMANLTALTRIILSNNNLTGPIPDSLKALPSLQALDVTNNNLNGKIPSFSNSVVLKLSGNPMLGSDSGPSPGGGAGPGSPSGSGSPGSSSDGSESSNGAMIGGIIVAVLVLVGCLVCLVYYRRRKNQAQKFGRVDTQSRLSEQDLVKIGTVGVNIHTGASSEVYSEGSMESATNAHLVEAKGMLISIQALRKATDNFSEGNILGRGGFGTVYKGELNGTLVAVKRSECDIMGKKGMEEFRAEIDVLRKVRHRNLVGLLGYCVDDNERLLVYEYMAEGTLGEHLFDLNETGYSALTWKQRLTIALDVARGIEYLHNLAQESFIHRDLKPSNILLDKDMRAKVSDFGLVKLADKEKSMMTRLAGTFGYLAPEYAITGKVSTKVDVYAFGVILMELIAGRKVLDESLPDEESHLVACFRRNMLNKEKFMKSVDPILNLDGEGWNSMFEIAELAGHCTVREPNQRPDIGHAVNVLGPLVEKWKPSQFEDEDNYGDSSSNLTKELEKWQFSDDSSTMGTFSSYK